MRLVPYARRTVWQGHCSHIRIRRSRYICTSWMWLCRACLEACHDFLNTRDISSTVLLIILLGEKSMIFQICIKPNSQDYAASPCAKSCHISPSSRHHLSRTITSISIHDASRDIIAMHRDELVDTLSLGNPWFRNYCCISNS